MSESKDKVFIDGMFVKRHEAAPEYCICSISIKEDRFTEFMTTHLNGKGYLNIEVKRGKEAAYYAELNTWKPDTSLSGEKKDYQDIGKKDEPVQESSGDEVYEPTIPF